MMPRWRLPVGRFDRAISRWSVRQTSSASARATTALGWTTDARVLLGAGLIYRLALAHTQAQRVQGSHFLAVIATTTVLHHLIKRVVAQRRPDRTRLRRDPALPLTGRADDAFPSGHAMHAGALASLFARLFPAVGGVVWIAAAALATTRIIMLAHWPSGVASGFALGLGVERCLARIRTPRSAA